MLNNTTTKMRDEARTELEERDYYLRWLEKQAKNKPMPMLVIQKRTLNTAGVVRVELRGLPFNKLSSSLYFFCKDMEEKTFARLFEAQIELAGIDQERFTKTLHKFFNETARVILKEGKFHIFAEFLSNSILHYHETKCGEVDDQYVAVLNSYMNLLMQQTEYLRPKKFDLEDVICGETTSGEIMTCPAFQPYLDVAADEAMDEYRKLHEKGHPVSLDELLEKACKKRGMQISSLKDIDWATKVDKSYSSQVRALTPYINEYCYDILPSVESPFACFMPVFWIINFAQDYSILDLDGMLKKRARTLPSNGQWVDFKFAEGYKGLFERVLFKEILYNDAIVMLYKFKTGVGDLSGFYNTKTGAFFSPLCVGEKGVADEALKFKRLVLFLYASLVTRNGDEMRVNMSSYVQLHIYTDKDVKPDFTIKTYEAIAYGMGGRLKDVYHQDIELGTYQPTGARAGNENYEIETKTIQGFIRKVGAGRTPSQEAVARAAALGFDLAADETYVQPFIRGSWKKKAAAEPKPQGEKGKRQRK